MIEEKIKINVSGYSGVFDKQYSPVSETCTLDIYFPDSKGPFPVIVSIHGGAFKKCDKRDEAMIGDMLLGLEKGYAIVGVNYRLSGEAQFPEPVKDIKQALRFIIDHADIYNLDPHRIVVWGGSAGGYFSIMSGLIAEVDLFDDSYSSATIPKVKGVVAMFPPTDFLMMDQQLQESGLLRIAPDHSAPDSPESLFVGEPILNRSEKVLQSNPMRYINGTMPEMLIQHGRADAIVPYQQSEMFVNEAAKRGFAHKIKYEIIEDAGHGDQKFRMSENLKTVFEFIERCIES